ncbi:hypothetical protein Tco_0877789 [Tanacetum coccineum]|uniref:Uncharacterized protein n=1 Tax=Tanacetum coccineum TaxID=301880 RepID=A0ABQ5BZI2_9ASTR
MYRYNRKGFLKDDDNSDDSIFIVDPGWDDYCLQELKLNHNVVDHLTTTGITIIPGERRSVEELEGMSWNLKPSEQTMVCVPSRVAVNERLNRSLSLQFERYRRAPQPARYSVDQHDQKILGNDHLDEDEEYFIGICLHDPQTQHIPCDICEPSGKWDYYVRYDAPINTTPIEELAATGWGDEFSDSGATPRKVTILDEKDNWDDDKRNEGKILVLQEQFSQNQQDFLDEYLPQ